MGLTPKQRPNQDTPAAQAEARELRKRAAVAVHQGKSAQAMADADAVMAAHAQAGPAGEPYLTARFWRAIALSQLGQHAAAAGEFGRLVEDAVPVLGDKHVTVVLSRISRAGQLTCLARYDEAEAECRTAIKMSGKIKTWPHDSRDSYQLSAVSQLVVTLNGRGLPEQAESMARSAIRRARGSLRLSAHHLIPVRIGLATSLISQHRYSEARRVLEDLQPAHPHPWSNVSIQIQLAAAELGLGMLGEAEARARDAVTEAERLQGPAHFSALRAGTLLGSAIARQGRPDEARHQLRANAEAWLEHFGEYHPRTVAAQEELARIGQDTGAAD
jgi:tetratricopeptide (TPR) repeat protein